MTEEDLQVFVHAQVKVGEVWERFKHPGTHRLEIERAGARQVLTVAARPLLP
jgi:hypothetical protein